MAGVAFRLVLGRDPGTINELSEQVGNALNGITFLLFGAILLGPALGELTWQLVAYAVLSLTVVRMAPVAIAMLGTRARWPTLGFMGWFGPAGPRLDRLRGDRGRGVAASRTSTSSSWRST